MPPASWPSAVSFSDWWSWPSISRCVVMSRTIAMSPSRPPWRLRNPDSVTDSVSGRGRPWARLISNASRSAPWLSLRRPAPYSRSGSSSVIRRPSACSAERPKVRSAAGFQPSTRSSAVMVMIASPAEAMSCSSERLVSAISP